MRRSEGYMMTHDIDWFFKCNNKAFHCASNGLILPEKFRDSEYLTSISEIVYTLPEKYDVSYNEEWLTYIIDSQIHLLQETEFDDRVIRDNYIVSFTFMARRGFFSLDRSFDKEYPYVLVAAPKGPDVVIPQGVHPINDNHRPLKNAMQEYDINLIAQFDFDKIW